jgi:hypothetical protein
MVRKRKDLAWTRTLLLFGVSGTSGRLKPIMNQFKRLRPIGLGRSLRSNRTRHPHRQTFARTIQLSHSADAVDVRSLSSLEKIAG